MSSSVKRSINLSLGTLIVTLLAMTLIAILTAGYVASSIENVSLYQNEEVRRNDDISHILNDIGHELDLFKEKDRLPPIHLLQYLGKLEQQVATLQILWDEDATELGDISQSIASMKKRWNEFFTSTHWTELTSAALQAIVSELRGELSLVRTRFTSIARISRYKEFQDELRKTLRLVDICTKNLMFYENFSEIHLTNIANALPEIDDFLRYRRAVSSGKAHKNIVDSTAQAVFAFHSALYAIAEEGASGITSTSDSMMHVADSRFHEMYDSVQQLQTLIGDGIKQTQSNIIAQVLRTKMAAIVLLVTSTLIALFIAIRAQADINLGFDRLLAGVNSFSQGEFDTRIAESDKQEFNTLARGFNSMAERLQEREFERVTYMEELQQAQQRADEANTAKSRFLASMSHEIRTPMNGVLGMAELLAAEQLSARQRNFIETIQDSGKTLLALINDILDLSKIEAGHLEIDPMPFNLTSMVEGVGQLMATVANRKGVELAVIIDHRLKVERLGDAARIRQVLLNLVGNAIKFTANGTVTLRVGFPGSQMASTADGNENLRFEVVDTGVGIAAEEQKRIFQPFNQIKDSARGTGGTGLGLSICSNLVTLMQGHIGLKSTPGRGSTFSFEIPLAFSELPESAALDLKKSAHVRQADIMVFVMSRSNATLESLQEQLRRMDIPHHVSTSARDGLMKLQRYMQGNQERRAVLLMDRQLDDIGGLEFVHRVRESLPALTHTVISLCHSGDETTLQAAWRAAGIGSWIYMPVTQSALHDELALVQGPGMEQASDLAPVAPSLHFGSVEMESDSDKPGGNSETPLTDECLPLARILVAEDNLVNQQVVSLMLESLDCEVTLSENGRRCVENLECNDFDLVLMDCDMPEMDGFEATAEMRRRERIEGRPRQIIVALTANALQGDRERCLAAGMDDFLSKPVSLAELEATLLRYVPGFGGDEVSTERVAA